MIADWQMELIFNHEYQYEHNEYKQQETGLQCSANKPY